MEGAGQSHKGGILKRITNADKVKVIMKKRPKPAIPENRTSRRQPLDGLKEGQQVSLRISGETRIGYKAIVNDTQEGILYKNEIFQELKRGQEIVGYVKKMREDNKIDLSLYAPGYKKIDPLARKIIAVLKAHGGFVAVTDNSSPQAISDLFGISKKTYKKVVGNLYRKRRIVIEENGIRLNRNADKP